MITPYYESQGVTLYHGDMMEIAPLIRTKFDAVITDPPYCETSLEWDVWPKQWPQILKEHSDVLWCFGSLRMFWDRRSEFEGWKLAQEIIWEKHNGSGFDADRFRRVHELAVNFYKGDWKNLRRKVPRVPGERRPSAKIKAAGQPPHRGDIKPQAYEYGDDRIQRSVIPCASCHGYAVNETQKPEGIIRPLIEYSVPVGGAVFDPFAGSGTVLYVARSLGIRAVGIEKRKAQCEEIVKRLAQHELGIV